MTASLAFGYHVYDIALAARRGEMMKRSIMSALAMVTMVVQISLLAAAAHAAPPPPDCVDKYVGEWAYPVGTSTIMPDGTAIPHCFMCVPMMVWTCEGNTMYYGFTAASPRQFVNILFDENHMRSTNNGAISTRIGGSPPRAASSPAPSTQAAIDTKAGNADGKPQPIGSKPVPPGTPAYSRYIYDPTAENCAAAREIDRDSAAWAALCARLIRPPSEVSGPGGNTAQTAGYYTAPNSRGEVFRIIPRPIPPGSPAYNRYFYDPSPQNCEATRPFDKQSATWAVLCVQSQPGRVRPVALRAAPAGSSILSGRNGTVAAAGSCAGYSSNAVLEPYWGYNRAYTGRTMCSVPNISEAQCRNVGGDWKPDNGSGKVICFLPALETSPSRGQPGRTAAESQPANVAAAQPSSTVIAGPVAITAIGEPGQSPGTAIEHGPGSVRYFEADKTSTVGAIRDDLTETQKDALDMYHRGLIGLPALRVGFARLQQDRRDDVIYVTDADAKALADAGATSTGSPRRNAASDDDFSVTNAASAKAILDGWRMRNDVIEIIPGGLGFYNKTTDVTLWMPDDCATGDMKCLAERLPYLDAYVTPGGLADRRLPGGIKDAEGLAIDLLRKVILAEIKGDRRKLLNLVCYLGKESGLTERDKGKPEDKHLWEQVCALGSYSIPELEGLVQQGQMEQSDALVDAWILNKVKPKMEEALAMMKNEGQRLQQQRLADSNNPSLPAAAREKAKSDYERIQLINGEAQRYNEAVIWKYGL